MPDLLRAFPRAPGSAVWICQNLTKRSEYECDTEAWTCSCPQFEHKRRCKHIEYAVYRAKLYNGDREAYEKWLGEVERA